MCEASAAVAPVSKQCLGSAYFSVLLLEMSCKICQDHARLTRTNVQNLIRVFLKDSCKNLTRSCKNYLVRSYKNVLVRFLQESYKIKRSKFLPYSCQILDKILHDISSREILQRIAFTKMSGIW